MNQHSKKNTEHTVFVRFVPPSSLLRRHHIEHHFSQIGPIRKASLIIPKVSAEDVAKASSYGFIKYTCEADAEEAARKLNKSNLKLPKTDQQAGSPHVFSVMVTLASQQMKKQQQEEKTEETEEAPAVDDKSAVPFISEQQKKHNRVIIRNLSFYARQNHIEEALQKYGKVLDVHIPTVQGKSRGFAFATFALTADAEKLIQEAKKTPFLISKRAVKVEISLSKHQHQQQRELASREKLKQEYQLKAKEELRQQNKQKGVEKGEDKDDGEDGSSNSDDGSSSDSDSDGDSDSNSDSDEDKDAEEEEEEDSDDEEEDSPKNLQLAVQEQRELFVRNLPFDCSRHDVFEAFRSYGKIQAIYLVTDPATKMPRGTCFVTYEKQTGAARAMKKAQSMLLKGRPLVLDYAVDRATAHTLKKDSSINAQGHNKDKRNMYLKMEGRVDDEKAWMVLGESDKLKRQRAWTDKHTKLKSPLFFINPNRVSIRNLSKTIDEGALKKLLFQAAQRGIEKGLVNVQDMVAQWTATGEHTQREMLDRSKPYTNGTLPDTENPLKEASLDERNTKRSIPSVYLDRDFEAAAKKNDKTSAPSRGFAFAEFTHHVQALACLRELNNNPAYSEEFAAGGRAAATAAAQKRNSKKKKKKDAGSEEEVVRSPRLIVEFTVENKAKAKQQGERRAHQQAHRSKQKSETKERRELKEKKSESKPLGRGAKQREKKRLRQLEKKEGATDEAPRKGQKKQKREQTVVEEEVRKPKVVKPPKKLNKRQREDKETDENFSNLVNKYKVAFQDAVGGTGSKEEKTAKAPDPRKEAMAEGKRWFE